MSDYEMNKNALALLQVHYPRASKFVKGFAYSALLLGAPVFVIFLPTDYQAFFGTKKEISDFLDYTLGSAAFLLGLSGMIHGYFLLKLNQKLQEQGLEVLEFTKRSYKVTRDYKSSQIKCCIHMVMGFFLLSLGLGIVFYG